MEDTQIPNQPKQITLRQASKIFGIPLSTLRKHATNKKIPHRRLFGRIYLSTETFENFLKSLEVEVSTSDR